VKLFALRNINSTCNDTLLAMTPFRRLHLLSLLFSKNLWEGDILARFHCVFAGGRGRKYQQNFTCPKQSPAESSCAEIPNND
jgi:hypothetical protein